LETAGASLGAPTWSADIKSELSKAVLDDILRPFGQETMAAVPCQTLDGGFGLL